MKEIIEGILKELNVDYITENDINKIDKSKIILYWDIDNEEKMTDIERNLKDFLKEEKL